MISLGLSKRERSRRKCRAKRKGGQKLGQIEEILHVDVIKRDKEGMEWIKTLKT